VSDVVCREVDLTKNSPADLAFCKSPGKTQKAIDIVAIFEVKMSIVWNWELRMDGEKSELNCIGDYTMHKGNPSLLRSDSMLKAIGKSAIIRSHWYESSKIPIIILGNTPITARYLKAVDDLKRTGIIQGFWSLNPKPLESKDDLKTTPKAGFIKMDSLEELLTNMEGLLSEPFEFFSGMKSKWELGQILEMANRERSFEEKAQKFLSLIRSEHEK
jgi:hypothetical protein